MIVECCVAGIATVVLSVFLVRPKDIHPPEAVSSVAHLHEKKRAIHEGLRDLQFDFRMAKLSDADYLKREEFTIDLADFHRRFGAPSARPTR